MATERSPEVAQPVSEGVPSWRPEYMGYAESIGSVQKAGSGVIFSLVAKSLNRSRVLQVHEGNANFFGLQVNDLTGNYSGPGSAPSWRGSPTAQSTRRTRSSPVLV